MKTPLPGLLMLALLSGGLYAQGLVQNSDISYMAGPGWRRPQTIPGTNVTVSGATGYNSQINYGYQVARSSAGNLWVEFYPTTFMSTGKGSTSIGGSYDPGGFVAAPAARYMIPVQARLSLYAVAGAGFGAFDYAVIASDNASVKTKTTWHGVFDFGGGADLRLSNRFSLRGELRDFVTGRGLNGVPGRHHLIPMFGLAVHF